MKVLVVEDDFTSRKLLKTFLEKIAEVDIAANGEEAIQAFALSQREGKPYQLVCLDIMMPKMDGLEVVTKLREIEAAQGIKGLDGVKIIMTSSLQDKESILASFRRGCEAYLVKPVERKKLDEKLRTLGLPATTESSPSKETKQ